MKLSILCNTNRIRLFKGRWPLPALQPQMLSRHGRAPSILVLIRRLPGFPRCHQDHSSYVVAIPDQGIEDASGDPSRVSSFNSSRHCTDGCFEGWTASVILQSATAMMEHIIDTGVDIWILGTFDRYGHPTRWGRDVKDAGARPPR